MNHFCEADDRISNLGSGRTMDPRIGMLMREGRSLYYAFVDGYARPAVEGTLEAVEVRLGLRQRVAHTTASSRAVKPCKDWNVTMRFQHPAWDEKDGIEYRGISARSKSEANRIAARQARNDGHACGHRGRYTFTAVESGSQP